MRNCLPIIAAAVLSISGCESTVNSSGVDTPPTVDVSMKQGGEANVVASSETAIATAAQCPDGRTIGPGKIVVAEFPVRLRVTASDDDDVAYVETRLINAAVTDIEHITTIQSHFGYQGTEFVFLTVGSRDHQWKDHGVVTFDATPLGGNTGTFLIDATARDFAGHQVYTGRPLVGTLGSFCQ